MPAGRFAGGPPSTCRELVSFDGGVRAREEVVRPDRYRHLEAIDPSRPRIARGGGYSYAAASFGAGALVQETGAFDRILHFDPREGVLECEAGATLGRIFEVAAPAGWYLAVQPGYPRITVGGCVASDAHGKNQYRDGTFRRWVKGLRLFHPRTGVRSLDREHDAELFDLTCGGFGLTGQILDVRLQLARLPGHRIDVTRTRIGRFEELLPLLEERAPRADFLYSWHNLDVAGDRFGRGFLYSGEFVPSASADGTGRGRVVAVDSRTRQRLGVSLLSGATSPAFNHAYEWLQRLSPDRRDADLYSVLFPVATKAFYFHLFGRRGLHEYQIVIPREGFATLIRELQRRLKEDPAPLTLASGKLFGGTRSGLRFDGAGLCLAFDFARSAAGARLAVFLDRLVCELGGWPNVVKDSRLPRPVVEACYPQYDAVRSALQRFDPERLYRSELSVRLDL